MSEYAVVVVIRADEPEQAWEQLNGLIRSFGEFSEAVPYVGAPWRLPKNEEKLVEFGTEALHMSVNGRRTALEPAD